ncbi:fumarylacetoacetate hydrolase family protein [Roseateles albus]|uniref:Fumarylacetoacetate hydrolase family protein n=1 Tax=Roseateles albus TaxID=2987525 RepID=A0ABT5KEW8_9BURK|nr:fumarylacetoacetate hydrolase family protein [Roseateles albus]MDC8772468.1 fumarylacetoacetate hydrolase family protein [Roseateles albus]
MKLASYRDGSRDGQLIVVSRDMSQAHYANGIATRLQQVLDDWGFLSPQLEELYTQLNHGKLRHAFNFEPKQCMAPLPRAYQRVSGGAYPSTAASQLSEPAMARGVSDDFLGPCEPALFASEAMGIDFEAGLAVITGDIACGTQPAQALEGVRLLALVNDWRLRHVRSGELHSQALSAFGPVAVTPDELGAAWSAGRVDLPLQVMWNGRKVGLCEAGSDMSFHFGQLIAHAAKTRRLRAGSVIGSGYVANKDASRGFASIAEKRALEALEAGQAKTEYMQFGDSIRVEIKGRDGLSVFGAIDQDVGALFEAAAEAASEAIKA